MPTLLRFRLPDGETAAIPVERALVAGWTARDRAAVDHHIEELAAIGVPPPSTVPLYYRVAAQLLTQEPVIEVVGEGTSGEVEPVVVSDGARTLLTLGSDHTDRALEAHSVALSKQVCAKPVGGEAWDLAQVADHLDALELSASIEEDGRFVPYQAGRLAAIRPLAELIAGAPYAEGGLLPAGVAMMCGTLGVLSGGVRPARRMRLALVDPVLGRRLAHDYETRPLPAIA